VTASFSGSVNISSSSGLASVPLQPGAVSEPIPLAVGANSLQALSFEDGLFPFAVSREAADLTAVSLVAINEDGSTRFVTPQSTADPHVLTLTLP